VIYPSTLVSDKYSPESNTFNLNDVARRPKNVVITLYYVFFSDFGHVTLRKIQYDSP